VSKQRTKLLWNILAKLSMDTFIMRSSEYQVGSKPFYFTFIYAVKRYNTNVQTPHVYADGLGTNPVGGGSERIKIEGVRERKEETGGRRRGEKEHSPFIAIAYFATSL
jgi:hypothetical protein